MRAPSRVKERELTPEATAHIAATTQRATVPVRTIFVSFVRAGGMLFGGGYAMLPLLERELVKRRGWLTRDEMVDLFALSQVVPGVIAVNVSLLTGQRLRGTAGAIAAMTGVVVIPFLALLLFANLYDLLIHNPLVMHFTRGLRPAVAGLLLGTALRMVLQNWRERLCVALGIASFALMLIWEVNPIWPIVSIIAIGIGWQVYLDRTTANAAAAERREGDQTS